MAKKNKKGYIAITEKQFDNMIENTCTLYDITWGLSKDLRFYRKFISILSFTLGAFIISIIAMVA